MFVAVAGVRESEVEAVARAVLPKFYMDDVGVAAWNVFGSSVGRRFVVTRWAMVVVERVAKDHLGVDEVVGRDLEVGRCGYATGFLRRAEETLAKQVTTICGGEKADVDMQAGVGTVVLIFLQATVLHAVFY